MPQLSLQNSTAHYESLIHKALFPRWIHTGGYISACVSDEGNRVTLIGYVDPSPQEADFLINKVETSLGRKSEIHWKRIGNDTEILLSLSSLEDAALPSPIPQPPQSKLPGILEEFGNN